MTRPRRLPWMRDAVCLEYPRQWWFVERGSTGVKAKQICRRCLVRQECLTYALEHAERHGIWGGYHHNDFLRWRRPSTCRLCRRRLALAEVAALVIAETEPSRWCCRTCRQCQIRDLEVAS